MQRTAQVDTAEHAAELVCAFDTVLNPLLEDLGLAQNVEKRESIFRFVGRGAWNEMHTVLSGTVDVGGKVGLSARYLGHGLM